MMVERPGARFARGTVPVGEFVLDYAEAGPKDAVTLVSFPGSAGLEMSTAKDILARTYHVVEINPPGWGGKDDLSRPMPMSELGGLLAEAANHLVDGDYYVIGTSMGGVNAIYAAAAHPGRIKGILLEGGMAPARMTDLYAPPPDVLPADAADEPATEPQYPMPPVNPRKPWATEDFIREQMANRFKMFRWVAPDFLPEEALQAVTKSGIPVLALLGERDEILKPTQRATFATYLPKADFRLVPGGTHDLQNNNPEQFVALVDELVRR